MTEGGHVPVETQAQYIICAYSLWWAQMNPVDTMLAFHRSPLKTVAPLTVSIEPQSLSMPRYARAVTPRLTIEWE